MPTRLPLRRASNAATLIASPSALREAPAGPTQLATRSSGDRHLGHFDGFFVVHHVSGFERRFDAEDFQFVHRAFADEFFD